VKNTNFDYGTRYGGHQRGMKLLEDVISHVVVQQVTIKTGTPEGPIVTTVRFAAFPQANRNESNATSRDQLNRGRAWKMEKKRVSGWVCAE